MAEFRAGEGRTVREFVEAAQKSWANSFRRQAQDLNHLKQSRRADPGELRRRAAELAEAKYWRDNPPTRAFRANDTLQGVGKHVLADRLLDGSIALAKTPIENMTEGVPGVQDPGMASTIAYGNRRYHNEGTMPRGPANFEVREALSQKNSDSTRAKLDVHPLVVEVLDFVQPGDRSHGHGRCAEIVAISDLVWSIDPHRLLHGAEGLKKVQREFERRAVVTAAHLRDNPRQAKTEQEKRKAGPRRPDPDEFPNQKEAVAPCKTCARVARTLCIATVPPWPVDRVSPARPGLRNRLDHLRTAVRQPQSVRDPKQEVDPARRRRVTFAHSPTMIRPTLT
ncbi:MULTISPECIES: YwqJ-related putative deaminase [Saccharothrix]|uniref:YwqJ-related putative deaminase n=1 Tax=Saccharothrix TaxID=2071 RepID=UPI00093AE618|nr:YwqJ-related putative deaminase [Saccharothrix sp. CB00851]OKI26389.1 hypothetical protein A6A25_32410 [Saccharothrix sp. CB00851]